MPRCSSAHEMALKLPSGEVSHWQQAFTPAPSSAASGAQGHGPCKLWAQPLTWSFPLAPSLPKSWSLVTRGARQPRVQGRQGAWHTQEPLARIFDWEGRSLFSCGVSALAGAPAGCCFPELLSPKIRALPVCHPAVQP